MAIVYALVRGYENGDWDTVVQQAEDIEASAAEIGKIYVESVHWGGGGPGRRTLILRRQGPRENRILIAVIRYCRPSSSNVIGDATVRPPRYVSPRFPRRRIQRHQISLFDSRSNGILTMNSVPTPSSLRSSMDPP
jgi:hypothetical protein